MRKTPNIEMLAIVARGLEGLTKPFAFVGGATIDLHITDEASPSVRPTDDVDCVFEVASLVEHHLLEEELRRLGLKNSMTEGPICRWIYKGIKVDVMPVNGDHLGFTNRWHPLGIAEAITTELPSGENIRIFSTPLLLASKLEAFGGRGKGDYYGSHDLEDIVLVLDGCLDVNHRITSAPTEVREYLRAEAAELLASEAFIESLPGHLRDAASPSTRSGEKILAILRRIANP